MMVATPSRWRQLARRVMMATLPRRFFLAEGRPESREVCLTFDDGPHPEYTPRLLDVLKEHGVRATFFVIGRAASEFPELVRRMVEEGHVVGNHTFNHKLELLSVEELLREVQQTTETLQGILGRTPTLFRPPKGKIGARHLIPLWRARQTIVLWNADPKDFACQQAEDVRDWFRRFPVQSGSIVLMHDSYPHATVVLPEVIANARARGLSFCTIPEVLT